MDALLQDFLMLWELLFFQNTNKQLLSKIQAAFLLDHQQTSLDG